MTVIQASDGWIVTYSSKSKTVLAGPFPTMADGWRWIDRQQGEPLNRAQHTSDWAFRKMADGGAA